MNAQTNNAFISLEMCFVLGKSLYTGVVPHVGIGRDGVIKKAMPEPALTTIEESQFLKSQTKNVLLLLMIVCVTVVVCCRSDICGCISG